MMSKVEVVSRMAALRLHRPVRDQQRARAGIEERARKARQCFRAGLVAGDGVAGGEHHPVGIELELRHLAGGEEAVIEFARLSGKRERQRWLGQSLDLAGDETMGGEIDDAIIGSADARLTVVSLASLRRWMSLAGAPRFCATALSSSAVSGSRGSACASMVRSMPAPCQNSV